MPHVDLAPFLAAQGAVILVAAGVAVVALRRCLRRMREAPDRRAAVLFQFGHAMQGVPIFVPLVMLAAWAVNHGAHPPHLAEWTFAFGWTGYVVSWLATTFVMSHAWCAAIPERWTRTSFVVTVSIQSAWFVLPPLVAGWGAVLVARDAARGGGPPDPTGAICWLVATTLTGLIVARVIKKLSDSGSMNEETARVTGLLASASKETELPQVAIAACRRAGLADALAYRHRGVEHIAIDTAVAATFPDDEIAAVLLHELGHHRLGHIRRRIRLERIAIIGTVLVPTVVGLGHVLTFLIVSVLLRQYSALPRWRRQEFEADKFAAERCGPRPIGAALARLHRIALVPDDFEGARRAMTHPDLVRRLEALGLTPADVAASELPATRVLDPVALAPPRRDSAGRVEDPTQP